MYVLTCSRCHRPLPELDTAGWRACQSCGAVVRTVVFPALFRERKVGQSGEGIESEGESSCFFHPNKKAVVPCDSCGRFLCSLCDLEMRGQHLCPQCLETGAKKGKLRNLDNHRLLYDSLALALATWPLLIFYFTLFTAPAALYVAIRYWNAPTSLLPRRTHLRLAVAMALSLLQLGGWVLLFGYLLTR